MATTIISAARYGKDNVRVCKVERDAKTGTQNVVEMTVTVLLEGDIAIAYARRLQRPRPDV